MNIIIRRNNARRSSCNCGICYSNYSVDTDFSRNNRLTSTWNFKSSCLCRWSYSSGCLQKIKWRWEQLCELGPKFGYFPETSKLWLIVKVNSENKTKDTFCRRGFNRSEEVSKQTPLGNLLLENFLCETDLSGIRQIFGRVLCFQSKLMGQRFRNTFGYC